MRLEDNYQEESQAKGAGFLFKAVIGVGIFLTAVVCCVLFVNREALFKPQGEKQQVSAPNASEDVLSSIISGSTLVSDDLDIWDDYPKEEDKQPVIEQVSEEKSEDDPSEGGTKTLVVHADGKEEWYNINKYLPQNEYPESSFISNNGRMFYYVDGTEMSYAGMEVSKYQGYIDYNKVKKDGIDYVIIQLGARGYGTGQLTLDDYFMDNIKRATDAGLEVGVRFNSQAITVEEAKEEAAFVLQYLADYDISYPVIFSMEHVANDTARIDVLTKEEKTQIAKAFLEDITAAGYNAMLSGDKEWMFADVNYAALSAYDVCLVQSSEKPDYPYRFYLWEYSEKGTVDGVSGQVPMSISLIDYTIK